MPWSPHHHEAYMHAFKELQSKIDSQKLTGQNSAEHLNAAQPSEFPVPSFGEHDLEPPANPDVFHPPKIERQSYKSYMSYRVKKESTSKRELGRSEKDRAAYET